MSELEIDYGGGVESDDEGHISLGEYDDVHARDLPLPSEEPPAAASAAAEVAIADAEPRQTAAQTAAAISEKGLGVIGKTDWMRKESKSFGGVYYANIKTNQTTWDVPEEVAAHEAALKKPGKSSTPPLPDSKQSSTLLERIDSRDSDKSKEKKRNRKRQRADPRPHSPGGRELKNDTYYGSGNRRELDDRREADDRRISNDRRAPDNRREDRGPGNRRQDRWSTRRKDHYNDDTLNTRTEADTYRPGAPSSPPPEREGNQRRPPSDQRRRSLSPEGRRGPNDGFRAPSQGGRRSPGPDQRNRGLSGQPPRDRGFQAQSGPPRQRSDERDFRGQADLPPRQNDQRNDRQYDQRKDRGRDQFDDSRRDDRGRGDMGPPPQRVDKPREEETRRQQDPPPPLPADPKVAQAYQRSRDRLPLDEPPRAFANGRRGGSPPRRRDDRSPERRDEPRMPPRNGPVDHNAELRRRLEAERSRLPTQATEPLEPEQRSGMMVNPARMQRVQQADEEARRQSGEEPRSRMDLPPTSLRTSNDIRSASQSSRQPPTPSERGNPNAPVNAPAGPSGPRAGPRVQIPDRASNRPLGPPSGPKNMNMRSGPMNARDEHQSPQSARRDTPRNAFGEHSSRPPFSPEGGPPTGPRRSVSGYDGYPPDRRPSGSSADQRRPSAFSDRRRDGPRPFDSVQRDRRPSEDGHRAKEDDSQAYRDADDYEITRPPVPNESGLEEPGQRYSDQMQTDDRPPDRFEEDRNGMDARRDLSADGDRARLERQPEVRTRPRDDEPYSASTGDGERPVKRRRDHEDAQPDLADHLGDAFQPNEPIEIGSSPAHIGTPPQPTLLSRMGGPPASMSIAAKSLRDDQVRAEEKSISLRGLASSQSARSDGNVRHTSGTEQHDVDSRQRATMVEGDDAAVDVDTAPENDAPSGKKQGPRGGRKRSRGRGRGRGQA